MSFLTLEAMTAALHAAAAGTSAAIPADRVWLDVAEAGLTAPYIIMSMAGSVGPHGSLYNGAYLEDQVYLIDVVATTRREAELLAGEIGVALHDTAPDGSYILRRENRAPRPANVPDQQLFTASYYYRLKLLQAAGT